MPIQNTFSAISKRGFGAFDPTPFSGSWSTFSFVGGAQNRRSGIFVSEDGSRFFVTYYDWAVPYSYGKVFKSENFGETYLTSLSVDFAEFSDIAGSYDGRYLLVGNDNELSNKCYKSTNFGASWTLINFNAGSQRYVAVAVSRSGEIQLVLAHYPQQYTLGVYTLYRSRNYGNTWEEIKYWVPSGGSSPYPVSGWPGGCISLNESGTTAVMSGSSPFLITNLRDNVPTFTNFSGFGADIPLIAIAKLAPIIVAASAQAVWISFNLGTTWSQIMASGSPQGWDKISISDDASVIMLAARFTNSWWISFNYGSTWESISATSGLSAFWYVVGVSGNGRVRYAISSNSTPHYRNIT